MSSILTGRRAYLLSLSSLKSPLQMAHKAEPSMAIITTLTLAFGLLEFGTTTAVSAFSPTNCSAAKPHVSCTETTSQIPLKLKPTKDQSRTRPFWLQLSPQLPPLPTTYSHLSLSSCSQRRKIHPAPELAICYSGLFTLLHKRLLHQMRCVGGLRRDWGILLILWGFDKLFQWRRL
jgi:hypothetical protein